jgi:hypothetical protein
MKRVRKLRNVVASGTFQQIGSFCWPASATRSGTPEEKDYKDDHQHQAEASTIVMVGGASIETASTEKEYQNNQKDN